MATTVITLLARLAADTSGFTKGLADANVAAGKSAKNAENLSREIRKIIPAANEAGDAVPHVAQQMADAVSEMARKMRLAEKAVSDTSGEMKQGSHVADQMAAACAEMARKMHSIESAAKDATHDVDALDDEIKHLDNDIEKVDGDGFKKEMNKAGDAAEHAESKMERASRAAKSVGSNLSSFGKTLGVGFAAAAAGAVLIGKSSISAATESFKVQKQTEAIIKATGGSAGVTAKQVDSLSIAMARKIGIDDEVIKRSANILLTFKSVHNEAGKGNKIFDRATRATYDMANVFGGADNAAKALGLALSDPEKGVTRLRRKGVEFTAAQMEMIKALMESGDKLGAQKVILSEIEHQVGGTAAATATAGDIMKVKLGDLQEVVGKTLLDAWNRFSKVLVDKVFPALERFWKETLPKLQDAWDKVRAKLGPVVTMLADKLAPVFKKLGEFIKNNGEVVAAFFAALTASAIIAGLVALAAAIWAVTGPVALVILGIAALVAGLVYAYKHSEKFREIVTKVFDAVKHVWNKLQKAIDDGKFDGLIKNAQKVLGGLKDAFGAAFGAIAAVIGAVVSFVMDIWDRFGSHLIDHLVTAWNAIFQVLRGVVQFFRGIFQIIQGIFTGDWRKVWEGVKNVFGGIWNAIVGTVKYAINLISTVIGLGIATISSVWSTIWGGLTGIVSSAWTGILNAIKAGWNGFAGFWNTVLDALTAPLRILGDHVPGMGWIKSIASIRIPLFGGDTSGGSASPQRYQSGGVTRFATGGLVTAPTLGLVGEAGPEAIIPLSRAGDLGLGGSTIVNVTVLVDPTSDPARAGQAVVDSLRAWTRRNGALPLRIA